MTAPTVEIVSHCWNYSRLLTYQLSSLLLHPPETPTRVTVCYTDEDVTTSRTLVSFTVLFRELGPRDPLLGRTGWPQLEPWPMDRERLMRRAIGRNEVALRSEADYVLFSDCDMLFGEGAIDTIARWWPDGATLCLPRHVLKCTHERGDEYIQAVIKSMTYDINPTDFAPVRYRRAIGGTQWVTGDAARRGYLPDHPRYQRPAGRWMKTNEDQPYRKWLGAGRGRAINVPNMYRIRHSRYGRTHVGVEN